MTNKYMKSLQYMDEYLESVSDEQFLEDYLSVEKSNGPLVKNFLEEYSFYDEQTYTIIGKSIDLESLDCTKYAANDNKFTSAA